MILNNGIVERRVLKNGNQFGLNSALFIIGAEKRRHKDCIFFRQEGRQLIRITAFERGGKKRDFCLDVCFCAEIRITLCIISNLSRRTDSDHKRIAVIFLKDGKR